MTHEEKINAAAMLLIAHGYQVYYDYIQDEFDIFSPQCELLDHTCPVEALYDLTTPKRTPEQEEAYQAGYARARYLVSQRLHLSTPDTMEDLIAQLEAR